MQQNLTGRGVRRKGGLTGPQREVWWELMAWGGWNWADLEGVLEGPRDLSEGVDSSL